MQSLASYDTASITSDSDSRYPYLFDFGSQELADEMILIDKELLVHIPWEELSTCGWMSPDKVHYVFSVESYTYKQHSSECIL